MGTEVEAAKNLLEERSCYQCRYIDQVTYRCGLHLKDLPPTLECDDWRKEPINRSHSKWSPESLKEIESWLGKDAETKLLKAIELEKEYGTWTASD